MSFGSGFTQGMSSGVGLGVQLAQQADMDARYKEVRDEAKRQQGALQQFFMSGGDPATAARVATELRPDGMEYEFMPAKDSAPAGNPETLPPVAPADDAPAVPAAVGVSAGSGGGAAAGGPVATPAVMYGPVAAGVSAAPVAGGAAVGADPATGAAQGGDAGSDGPLTFRFRPKGGGDDAWKTHTFKNREEYLAGAMGMLGDPRGWFDLMKSSREKAQLVEQENAKNATDPVELTGGGLGVRRVELGADGKLTSRIVPVDSAQMPKTKSQLDRDKEDYKHTQDVDLLNVKGRQDLGVVAAKQRSAETIVDKQLAGRREIAQLTAGRSAGRGQLAALEKSINMDLDALGHGKGMRNEVTPDGRVIQTFGRPADFYAQLTADANNTDPKADQQRKATARRVLANMQTFQALSARVAAGDGAAGYFGSADSPDYVSDIME